MSRENGASGGVSRDQLITIADLNEFKKDILFELKKMLREMAGQPNKRWLKSFEVRKLLNVSPNTLTNMRVNGSLPFTKIGGVIYYDYEDIQIMLATNKSK